jgi:hypothetical protein
MEVAQFKASLLILHHYMQSYKIPTAHSVNCPTSVVNSSEAGMMVVAWTVDGDAARHKVDSWSSMLTA